jgi:hypothetical protein
MVKVYGTSNPDIQELLKILKLAAISGGNIEWHLHADAAIKQSFFRNNENIECIAIFAVIDGEAKPIGFVESSTIEVLINSDRKVIPVYKGGDLIIKGFLNREKVFSYEPIKLMLIADSLKDMKAKAKYIMKMLLNPDIEVEVEQKYLGLGFELSEEPVPVPGPKPIRIIKMPRPSTLEPIEE